MDKHLKKKGFTLVELMVVVVILGVLFIILINSVSFSTDTAKSTGVSTTFKELQIACELTAHEALGYNSFGWDTGDANCNKVRDYVHVGDANTNGIEDAGETWTNEIVYTENWTGRYTLKKDGASILDDNAVLSLQKAFNANIDAKLHISIFTDGTITFSNQFLDPWGNEYTGMYLCGDDEKDGGAFVFFSPGPDRQLGTTASISNGQVTLEKTSGQKSLDDYVFVAVYAYNSNGKGRLSVTTYGF